MSEKVIDLTPYLVKKRRARKSYGQSVCCPNCSSKDDWELFCKPESTGDLIVTALVCSNPDCPVPTFVEIERGVLIK